MATGGPVEVRIVVLQAEQVAAMVRTAVVEEFARRDVAAETARVLARPWWLRAWDYVADAAWR
jgi:hypothetical protein